MFSYDLYNNLFHNPDSPIIPLNVIPRAERITPTKSINKTAPTRLNAVCAPPVIDCDILYSADPSVSGVASFTSSVTVKRTALTTIMSSTITINAKTALNPSFALLIFKVLINQVITSFQCVLRRG